jgi:hypothetical protein
MDKLEQRPRDALPAAPSSVRPAPRSAPGKHRVEAVVKTPVSR